MKDTMDPTTRFALALNEAAQHRRSADALVREAADQITRAQAKEHESHGHRFSIVRSITSAASDGVTGIEREVSQELARQAGQPFDRHRPWIPWSAFTRTMIVGTASNGGYLVGNPATAAVDALFPHSTVIRLGAQVIDGLTANISIPRVTANGTAYWLAEATGTATASQPTLGVHAGQPYLVGAYTELSRSLSMLAPDTADRLAGNHLLNLVGAKIDAAAIAGTGTTSLTGITLTSGLADLFTGTGFDHADALLMVKKVAVSSANDENIRVLSTPSARELLSKRAVVGTAAPFIWGADRMADKPAYVSENVPSATVIVGDFSTLFLLLWGQGVQVEVNPYAQFQAGAVGYRILAGVDVAVTQPGAFAVSTGLT